MSKISHHCFHGLYSTNYNVNGDIYYGKFDIPIIDFPAILGVPSDIEYTEQRPISYWQLPSVYLDLLKDTKKFLEFKTEDEAFIWYKKTLNQRNYDKLTVPLVKNYFKFKKKDFHKYRFLFNGMIKTGRITTNSYSDYNAKFTEIYPVDVNTTPLQIRKRNWSINSSTNIYNDFNGMVLLNDENFKNRIPFNKMYYAGGYFDGGPEQQVNVLNTEELYGFNANKEYYGSSNTNFIYNQDWIFNENYVKINQFPFFRKYPYDRSNLNNPVFPYRVSSSYISPEINFAFGSTVSLNNKEKKFEFNKVGNIIADLNYTNTDPSVAQEESNRVSAGNNLKAQLSAVFYLKETEEFMVFFEYFNEIVASSALIFGSSSISSSLEWRVRNPLLIERSNSYISSLNYKEQYKEEYKLIDVEKKNIDIFIETDGNNFINHTIEILVQQNTRTTIGIYDSSLTQENIGTYLDSATVNFDISQQAIYIYGWKKEDFSNDVRYPEP
jgi:hypothetical protein